LFATPPVRQIGLVIESCCLAESQALAARIAELVRPSDVILLEGELGAGKSEFARAFLRALVGEPHLDVPSPTFTLVQRYDTPRGPVYHFDLWRLDSSADLSEIGWDEASDGIVLVEWPDRLGERRPIDALTVALQIIGPTRRRVTLSGWPGRIK
jgi:tRNA threonylcarbamoyladenosine biosynthesis protein TsaE